MGVDGFLRQVKDALQESHLRAFSGQTVVVDAFSWLHKACYGCAFELATGKQTDSYVRYMLRKVDLMRACGVRDVILVFDGQRLPLKASTHEKRQGSKEENRRIAMQLMRDSRRLDGEARKAEVAKAYQHFQRTVSITQTIVTNVMAALQANNVRYVVAPFEADAQMVWLCKTGTASAIVTEDSDVFLYCITSGVDTPVLFKLDDSGMVQTLSRPSLRAHCEASTNPFLKKLASLTTGDKHATRMFVQFCVLSGCDFLDSLPHMGIVTALKHVFSFRGAPGHLRVQRILSKLSSTTNGSSAMKVPSDFLDRFVMAESIFFHHIVFNATAQRCELLLDARDANCHDDILARVTASLGVDSKGGDASSGVLDLHDTPTDSPRTSFLGVVPTREVASGIYTGAICPRTLRSLTEAHDESDEFRPFSPPPYVLPPAPRRSNSIKAPTSLDMDTLDNDDGDGAGDESRAAGLADRPRVVRPQAPTKPSPEAIERTLAEQARTRETSFKSLLSVYAKPQAAASPTELTGATSSPAPSAQSSASPEASTTSRASSSSSWLLQRVSSAPSSSTSSSTSSGAATSASNKRRLESDEVATTKRVATPFRDLVHKNRASGAVASAEAVVDDSAARSSSQWTPPSSIGRRLSASSGLSASSERLKRASGVAKVSKAQQLKTQPKASTLLQFFQKQQSQP